MMFNVPEKKKAKNKIVVMTSGVCNEACGMFIHNIKNRGEAIVVGYAGNPKEPNMNYEVGQSPTMHADGGYFLKASSLRLNRQGIHVNMGVAATYKHDYSFRTNIPNEFQVNTVDEVVRLGRFGSARLSNFVGVALEVVEKYKKECNVDGNMIAENSKCSDENDNMGGNPCSGDGLWNWGMCVIDSCDKGMVYDYVNYECVIDVCTYVEGDGMTTTDIVAIVVISCITFVLLIVIIAVIILGVALGYNNKHSKYSIVG